MVPQTRTLVGETTHSGDAGADAGAQLGNGLVACATCHQGLTKPLNGANMVNDYPGLGPLAPPGPLHGPGPSPSGLHQRPGLRSGIVNSAHSATSPSISTCRRSAFWLFFLFFLGLVSYNRRWDKREGYPMKASPFSSATSVGFPAMPQDPEVYVLNEGGTTTAPHFYQQAPVSAEPLYQFAGTPLSPVGNPLLAGIGPGSWVQKKDAPMLTEHGDLLLQPLRLLPEWTVGKGEADPRGMTVFDWRWERVGTVRDIWIDRGIKIIRILEIELLPELGGGHVLVPIYHTGDPGERARGAGDGAAVDQFADVPRPASADQITGPEDERLNAYFAAGNFYRRRPPVRARRS